MHSDCTCGQRLCASRCHSESALHRVQNCLLVAAMAATDASVTLAKMVRSESSGRVISMTGGSSSGSVVGESAVVDMRPSGSARVERERRAQTSACERVQ